MKLSLEPAFILHTRPFRETSLLADVWVKKHGRVGVIAKGAKRPKSPMRGRLNPFKEVIISTVGRGELLTLTHIETIGPPGLPLSGRILLDGFYVNELLTKLLAKHDAAPALYDEYASLIRALQNASATSMELRWFEYSLLQQLGYGLDFEHDDKGEPITPEGCYDYHGEKGLIRVSHQVQPHIKGQSILNFVNHFCSPEDLSDLKWLMQKAIASSLSGKTLHSLGLVSGMGERQ